MQARTAQWKQNSLIFQPLSMPTQSLSVLVPILPELIYIVEEWTVMATVDNV